MSDSASIERGLRNIVQVLEIYNGTIAMLSGKIAKLEEKVEALENPPGRCTHIVYNGPTLSTYTAESSVPLAPPISP